MSDYKNLTDAISKFEAMGIDVPAEMLAAVEGMRHRHIEDAAIDFFREKKGMKADNAAIAWQERAFEWAEMVRVGFAADTVNRGRGKVLRRGFTVETPTGTLKVDLSEVIAADEKDEN